MPFEPFVKDLKHSLRMFAQSEVGDFLVIRRKLASSRRVFDRTKDRIDDPELVLA